REWNAVNTSKKYGRNRNTRSHLRLQEGLRMMRQSRVAGRVKSGEMKPFRRFIHFLVMKNVIQDLEKETLEASWIDIYGSSNDKEVSRYATSDDETHELCDLYEGS
ncbi:hypothetical protein Dimus_036956, partial [Dionaea muscipula]